MSSKTYYEYISSFNELFKQGRTAEAEALLKNKLMQDQNLDQGQVDKLIENLNLLKTKVGAR